MGDDYVLLDSSVDSYPRLYTGERLHTRDILDWLWELAKSPDARGKDFVLYGASYDFNNWCRIFGLSNVKLLASGGYIFCGPYVVQWMSGYKFEIRKLALPGKKGTLRGWKAKRAGVNHKDVEEIGYQRLPDGRVGLVFWDVLPFWQCKFTDALAKTFGSIPTLIEEGKAARGSFVHDKIEWVSKYNKLECTLLVSMMEHLRDWFKVVDIDLRSWNGPGAGAKALLRSHPVHEHNGRVLSKDGRKAKGYLCPSEVLDAALGSYAGGRNQLLKIGTVDHAYEYDIISAYPSAMCDLPCLTHGEWEHVTEYDQYSFGVWKVSYESTLPIHDYANLYPLFARSHKTGQIHYPYRVEDRWAHTVEVNSALRYDPDGVTIQEGWVWRPWICDYAKPLSWVRDVFKQRLWYKANHQEGASLALKLCLNSLYGSIAQARGGTLDKPPPTQQLLWAGAITAAIRAKLLDAAKSAEADICHMATDGIISLSPLKVDIGEDLGQWEAKELHNVMLVQYGVYFADEKSRYRGFSIPDDDVKKFRSQIEDRWTGKGGYYELAVPQNYFVTAALVAQGLAPYDDWCTWQSRNERLDLWSDDAEFMVKRPKIGELHNFREMLSPSGERLWTANPETRFDSAPHEPKWGAGVSFPQESALEDAYAVARHES